MPSIKKTIYKTFYTLTGNYMSSDKLVNRFMNLGYTTKLNKEIKAEDFPYINNIMLYEEILNNFLLDNKSILEVGCGRGGGGYYYTKYHHPKSYIGLDFSPGNIAICNKQNIADNCQFILGDAENFSFKTPFDVIINLESSHLYSNKELFFNCVNNSLSENGTFIYADIERSEMLTNTEGLLSQCGFRIVHKKNITKGVIESIDLNSAKLFPFTHKFPYLVPKMIKNLNVSKGSTTYNRLNDGKVSYMSYILEKD